MAGSSPRLSGLVLERCYSGSLRSFWPHKIPLAGLDPATHVFLFTLCGRRKTWVAGSSPRLSGSCGVPLERQLIRIVRGWRFACEQTIEAAAVHQIGADEAGEGERAGNRLLGCLRHAQQQKSDQRDGDLDAYGVVAGAEEAADFEDLLDPTEKQLDRPAPLVEIGDFLGRGVEIVREDAQHLAGV